MGGGAKALRAALTAAALLCALAGPPAHAKIDRPSEAMRRVAALDALLAQGEVYSKRALRKLLANRTILIRRPGGRYAAVYLSSSGKAVWWRPGRERVERARFAVVDGRALCFDSRTKPKRDASGPGVGALRCRALAVFEELAVDSRRGDLFRLKRRRRAPWAFPETLESPRLRALQATAPRSP
ncbi:MAG: hypothetical protein AAGC56_13535 [Pseudomonadota bacterium]